MSYLALSEIAQVLPGTIRPALASAINLRKVDASRMIGYQCPDKFSKGLPLMLMPTSKMTQPSLA
jgi:hypothetical protein